MLSRAESIALIASPAKRSHHAFVQIAWNEFTSLPRRQLHIKLLCDERGDGTRQAPEDGNAYQRPAWVRQVDVVERVPVPAGRAAVDPAYLFPSPRTRPSSLSATPVSLGISRRWYQDRWGDRVKLQQKCRLPRTRRALVIGKRRLRARHQGASTPDRSRRRCTRPDRLTAKPTRKKARDDYWMASMISTAIDPRQQAVGDCQRISQGDIFDHPQRTGRLSSRQLANGVGARRAAS